MGKDELRKLVKEHVFLAALNSYERCNRLEDNDPKHYVPNVEAIVKHIESHYISKEAFTKVIDKVQAVNDSNGRYNACMELRQELGLEK